MQDKHEGSSDNPDQVSPSTPDMGQGSREQQYRLQVRPKLRIVPSEKD
jgi:hypothetical protein